MPEAWIALHFHFFSVPEEIIHNAVDVLLFNVERYQYRSAEHLWVG